MEDFSEFQQGRIILPQNLNIGKARALVSFIQSNLAPNVLLLECRQLENIGNEILIIEIELEIGQTRVVDIRNRERLAIVFHNEDSNAPTVFALRKEFPEIYHTYSPDNIFPRYLCLFEEDYEEMRINWTPFHFLKQIETWLIKAASGILHGDDQPLEPLMIGPKGNLIVPDEVLTRKTHSFIELIQINNSKENPTLIFIHSSQNPEPHPSNMTYIAFKFRIHAVQHNIGLSSAPFTLMQLHDCLYSSTSYNFTDQFRSELCNLMKNSLLQSQFSESRVVIILIIPKKRTSEAKPETEERWAFLLSGNLKEISDKFEIITWNQNASIPGLNLRKLRSIQEKAQSINIDIFPLAVHRAFSREFASEISGETKRMTQKIMAIGVGALGSQIFLNLIRNGIGEWIVIDDDDLLPHNLARHSLVNGVGLSKAVKIAETANEMISGNPIAKAISANVIKSGEKKKEINSAFEETDIILDMSTSIAAARYISNDINTNSRRFSVFLTPSGFDSVIIAEDTKRRSRLDSLEMQFYRHLINNQDLKKHTKREINYFRYSNTCRSLSNIIPQELVALHAANCCRRLKHIWKEEEGSSITIFHTQKDEFSVNCLILPAEDVIDYNLSDWNLRTDPWLLNKISKTRKTKLPFETGGVLVGSIDMARKIIYVVDTIPSPPDSEEWPNAYIRGKNRLNEKVKTINLQSFTKLTYIGEWHSHPEGCGPYASKDDTLHLEKQRNIRQLECLPALMLIMGHNDEYRFFVDEIDNYAEGKLE